MLCLARCHNAFSFALGCGGIFFTLFFARSFFTTSVVSPPVEVVPATISVMVAMHTGHKELLLSLRSILRGVTSQSNRPAPERYPAVFLPYCRRSFTPLP